MKKIPMTPSGLMRLEGELKHLKTVERPKVIRSIADARDHGDISENAEYHAAKEHQAIIEARISEIADKLQRAEVIDISALSGDEVIFGAKVTLANEDTDEETTYRIVGSEESDIRSGLLSVTSPLARAMIGKSEGDSIEVVTPKGERGYEIVKIEFG